MHCNKPLTKKKFWEEFMIPAFLEVLQSIWVSVGNTIN